MKVIGKLKFVSFENIESWSAYNILEKGLTFSNRYKLVKIKSFLSRNKTPIKIEENTYYKRPTIKINGGGVFLRDEVKGEKIGTKNQFLIRGGQFLLSKIDARNGAFGVVPEGLDRGIITGNFWTFDVDYNLINPYFLQLITRTKQFQNLSQSASVGTTNRNYLQEESFLNFHIPLPSISKQEAIVKNYYGKIEQAVAWEQEADTIEKSIETYLFKSLRIKQETEERTKKKGLQFVEFHKMDFWGVDKIKLDEGIHSLQYEVISIGDFPGLLVTCFRGKSPKYTETSSKFILNQKCNRWNSIDFSFVKSVDEDWYNNIDGDLFTKEGDILVNSTGEGTIGRATYITKDYDGLIYDSHILLLRLNKSIYNPILFVELFNSSYIQTQIDKIKSAQATKQTELGINNLLKIRIPILHNLQMQQAIIDQIDTYKNEIKVLREKAKKLKQQAEQEFEQMIFS
jgi:type I restriction-modification system specificity determinant